MLKKLMAGAVLALALSATPAFAQDSDAHADSTSLQATYTDVARHGMQEDVTGDWTDSKETNTVQESEMTRQMIQAEKARNAAENDKYGGAITIIAMSIVLAALIVLSLLFLGFGKISTMLQKRKKREAHGVSSDEALDHHQELDSGEVIAAISMALAEHLGQGHDMEDTILTIRRMRKAYSPWNSKIYNLRVTPEVHSQIPRIKK